ncbi:MAG: LPS export ABC transporter periplasmic protein LptC [Gammaproteobacteria bacterium]|nr:LPS export ABC transporter periplasmic protein LptC [Gammaproteobacteria bacterium]
MNLRRALAVLSLLAMAAGSSLLLHQLDSDETPAVSAAAPGIGYYLTDARLTGTGDDGHVLYRLSAHEVTQQPDDGNVNLADVTVDYDPAHEIPWRLTASRGRVIDDGKMIALSGNVVAATREARGPAAIIRTDYLEFDPGTDVASTDRKVVIEYAGSTVHAVGLRALLREDRLQLLADVSGHYAR